ncbi:MAG: hypothetical protein ACP5L5_11645, partial [Vulcanisaeta sp.]|uniref:hypothetical protein n=1 Tax=Vulcanisaeta sp. TaxID=2020871 RepID=UPI003D09E598
MTSTIATTHQLFNNITNVELNYPFPYPGVGVSVYEVPNLSTVSDPSTFFVPPSSPVSTTTPPIALNPVSTNTISGTNTLTLSYSANIISFGTSDIISAVDSAASGANTVIEISGGALTSSFLVYGPTPTNSVTFNANILPPSNTPYSISAYDSNIQANTVTSNLRVLNQLSLSYPYSVIHQGQSDVISAVLSGPTSNTLYLTANLLPSVTANTMSVSLKPIPSDILQLQVNGYTVANNTAGSNTIQPLFNANVLPYATYTITAMDTQDKINVQNQLTVVPPTALKMAELTYSGPTLTYTQPGTNYNLISSSLIANYSGESGFSTPMKLFAIEPFSFGGPTAYFDFYYPEYDLPTSTSAQSYIVLQITNASTTTPPSVGSSLYYLNYTPSLGVSGAISYTSSQSGSSPVKAPASFRTERGSEVGSIMPTQVTYDMAKSVDMLQFVVGPASTTVTTAEHTIGPFSVGAQALPNVTIANVTANCTFSTTSCTVNGISNLSATPSVSQAITPVKLNTAATPLAVLDTNANQASTLIVIGSKYVNSVAAQIFAQNPSLNSTFGPG